MRRISVSWQKFLLLAHILLLAAALVSGRWLYQGAFGRSDAFLAFNPYPLVTMADNIAYAPVNPFPHISPRSGRVVSNPLVYVWDWYTGFNGRLATAVMDSLIAQTTKWYPTPESFPWWLFRALSLYCLFAAPLTFMTAVGWAWGRRPVMTLILLLAVCAAWITSPNVYIFTVIFDVLLTDRNIQVWVLALLVLAVMNNWMEQKAWRWGLLALGILFLGAEQSVFSVPILLIAAAALNVRRNAGAGRTWRWQVFFYSGWSVLAAAIYFLSPGQRLRNTFLAIQSIRNFAPLEWCRKSAELGYGALFPQVPDSVWIWHLAGYAVFGLIMAVWTGCMLRKKPHDAHSAEPTLWGVGLMAFAFLTAFWSAMATLIASPYFPPYAIYYPSLLLLLGLVFVFWLVLEGASYLCEMFEARLHAADLLRTETAVRFLRIGLLVVGPLLFSGGLIGKVAVRNAPRLVFEYRHVKQQDQNRRRLYAEIVRLYNDGHRRFVLVNVWRLPVWGLHMDEVWSMAAYFRWRGLDNVSCVREEEWVAAGRPAENACYKLDCAELLGKK